MLYTVVWSESARFDMESIVEYIGQNNPLNARKVLEKIFNACGKLENYPKSGRIIPELKLQNIDTYRELIVDVWRILYRIEGSRIYILAVIDSRRNIDDALLLRAFNS